MDMHSAVQFISNVGFPIAMVLIMWKYMDDSTKSHKEEIDRLAGVINENTDAIAKIQTMLETIIKLGGNNK